MTSRLVEIVETKIFPALSVEPLLDIHVSPWESLFEALEAVEKRPKMQLFIIRRDPDELFLTIRRSQVPVEIFRAVCERLMAECIRHLPFRVDFYPKTEDKMTVLFLRHSY